MIQESPKVSIVMPTLNSERTIEKSLESIRKQRYPSKRVEILVIDGGSTDNTKKIAKKYSAKIINNPKKQQEYAKHLGILNATGKYAIFLDSDEVIKNINSIANKVSSLEANDDCSIATFSGYIKPPRSSSINTYINLFSDPFAFFIYGISTDHTFFVNEILRKYPAIKKTKKYYTVDTSGKKGNPLIDMCAGNCINLMNLKKEYKEKIKDVMIVPNIFDLLTKRNGKFILMKNDPTIHFSSDSIKKFVSKLHWRVIANTHYINIPGTGYANREKTQSVFLRYKKYLFPIYSLTLILPMVDAIKMYIKTKSPICFIHVPLTLIVCFDISFQRILKLLRIKPTLMAYGKQNIRIKI